MWPRDGMVDLRIGDETLTLSWDEWEARVRAGRIPPTALVRFEPATGTEWVPAAQLELYQSLRNEGAVAWRGQFSHSPPLLTALLVGVQIKLWWMQWWTSEVAVFVIRDLTLFTPPILEDGQVWRILTMGFAHRAAFHLALNMMWLAYCGWNLERALGRRNLLALYLGAVVVGSLFSMFGDPATPSLGASGGVYGLVGASIVFGFSRPQLLPERGRRLFGWALVPYLVVMFGSGLASEGTDNWSHLGGLLTGAFLGVVLDPPPVQRRPHWNRLWYGLIGGGTALVMALFALGGPRIHPLQDSASILYGSAVPTEEALSWSVPVGWKSGRNAAGDAAFVSPAGERSWSVVEREEKLPVSAEDARVEWVEKLGNAWPDAQVEALDGVEIAGHPGVGARVLLPEAAGGPRLLETRIAVRGLYTLQTTWEVEQARESWLGPLRRRLQSRTEWEDPPSLVSARIHYEHDPDSPKARDAWATELARAGRVAEAAEIRLELVERLPHVAGFWSGLLDLVAWYPDAVPDRDAVWQQAMAAHPTGSMAAGVAESMEAAGEPDAARGLLDLHWIELPGERSIRRARKRRGMSLELTMDGDPWTLVNDPVTGEPRPEPEVERIRALPIDLASARAHGAALARERASVVDAAVRALDTEDLRAAIDRVAWIREGRSDVSAEDRERIHRDLHRAGTSEHPPSWLPPEIVSAARRHPPAEPPPE